MKAFALLLSIPLAACASTVMVDAGPRYLEQTPYRATYESPLAAAQALIGNYPETTEAGPTLALNLSPSAEQPSRLVMIVTIDPVLDDSIAAEEWRAELVQGSDLRWTVAKLGLRRKCSRGPDAGTWGPFVCP